MSVKENQLPTAQEVTENNLIRTVDESGASQNMTVEQLGGLVGGSGDNVIFVTRSQSGYRYTLEIPAEELYVAMKSGKTVYIDLSEENNEDYMLFELRFFGKSSSGDYYSFSTTDGAQYSADNANDYPIELEE